MERHRRRNRVERRVLERCFGPAAGVADLIIIGDHPGWALLMSAAMPAMCGLDIEVPL
jgi:hypothetical protein